MTNTIAYVSRLLIYPIKSLNEVSTDRVTILKSGAIKGDRQWAIFDQSGKFVNGKRNDKIHKIRTKFNLETNKISLNVQESEDIKVFDIDQDLEGLSNWLSDYFGFPVNIKQDLDKGFPDDTLSPGPTIISTATLEAIASWYPNLEVEELRRRFRANIEISGVPAFWEDQLFTTAEKTLNFQIGKVQFLGINPCQRCVVVTRHSQTGEADANFQKIFVTKRQETLPHWVERSRFNHFYRLAINTQVPNTEAGKTISIGDELRLT
ncbi:MOSC domain containing protein [Rippkaea orientalis PCC 8801]|uniref:MOSC domain containing protein n=1 Tax=Rippkaea orientalis (strain PCC 8801 / RF-1) TaxID=41431 RepID=B7JU94_RIPO1|nr:MOSC N-terminal beta barrel domain-containing protein [Rippkaea orientalis]ACK64474.1 MOSC domain containing protein [Rippkaea orientalis PCC 8801]